MPKFQMDAELSYNLDVATARVADGTGQANQLGDNDVGKFVKLAGDSQYGLCAVGNEIEGILDSGPDQALTDGYAIAGVRKNGRARVMLDGLQATPGTGVCAVGDFMVCGTVVARGTSLNDVPPKACKATAAATAIVHKWRIVALLNTGAVGQIAVIEKL